MPASKTSMAMSTTMFSFLDPITHLRAKFGFGKSEPYEVAELATNGTYGQAPASLLLRDVLCQCWAEPRVCGNRLLSGVLDRPPGLARKSFRSADLKEKTTHGKHTASCFRYL